MSEGVKFDGDKLRYDLIPPELDAAVAAVLTYGAIKYGARNWEKGLDWTRVSAALDRHHGAWKAGENLDRETGMPHTWHMACCIAFLVAFEMRGAGKDDRPGPFPELMARVEGALGVALLGLDTPEPPRAKPNFGPGVEPNDDEICFLCDGKGWTRDEIGEQQPCPHCQVPEAGEPAL